MTFDTTICGIEISVDYCYSVSVGAEPRPPEDEAYIIITGVTHNGYNVLPIFNDGAMEVIEAMAMSDMALTMGF